MAKNRWELEEERKKREQAALQAAKAVTQTVTPKAAPPQTQSSNPFRTAAIEKNPATQIVPKATPVKQSPVKSVTPVQNYKVASNSGNVKNPVRNVVIDKNPVNTDLASLQKNMLGWHAAKRQGDTAKMTQLNMANNSIRQRLGLSYDPSSGVTFNQKTGKNLSVPTQLFARQNSAQGGRLAYQFPQSREAVGESHSTISLRPTMEEIAGGYGKTARGANAHKALYSLYNRAGETWSKEDKQLGKDAVNELYDEMSAIARMYGLEYNNRTTGPGAGMGMNDKNALELLRARGATDDILQYVAENIRYRDASDRLGEAGEAVGKNIAGAPVAFVETTGQQSENVANSRANPEYAALEQEAERLLIELQYTPVMNNDGTMTAAYQEKNNRLQQVKARLDALADKTPVDQSKWGQTMLREAKEAQANVTAGMSPVPRFLTNTGISIAGNAPTMALAAVPGVGPMIGAGVMGLNAAGQKAQELNERGFAPSEAIPRALGAGAIETITEKMPLDSMAALFRGEGKSLIKNMLAQFGVEAGEEMLSYLGNYVADAAANDPNAKFSMLEMLEQGLSGGVSGLFFGAAGTLGGYLGTRGAQDGVYYADTDQSVLRSANPELYDTFNSIDAVAQFLGGDRAQAIQEADTLIQKVKLAGDYTAQTGNIIDLTGQEFPKSEIGLVEQVGQFFDALGGHITRPGFGDVELNRRGVKDSMAHGIGRKKAITFAAVPDILKKGFLIDVQKDWKGRGYDTYVIAGRIQIDGKPHDVGAIVTRNDGVNRYYLHEVVAIEKGDTTSFKTGTSQKVSTPGDVVSPLSNNSIYPNTENGNPLNVDGRGAEPQALGHETAEQLTQRLLELDAEKKEIGAMLPGSTRTERFVKNKKEMQRVAAELAALEGSAERGPEHITFEQGQRVKALDRDNYGTVEAYYPESGFYDVNFRDATTGRNKTVTLAGDQLQGITEPGAPDIALQSMAEDQLAALESDSYTIPDEERIMNSDHLKVNEESERAGLMKAWQDVKRAENRAADVELGLTLTDKDRAMANAALRSGKESVNWELADNPQDALYYFEMQQAIKDANAPIIEYNRKRMEKIGLRADEDAEAIATKAKDKKIGLAFQRETMERNVRDIFGVNRAEAQQIIDRYFTPVHKAVADGNRLKTELRERVKKLRLNKHESALVQMTMEGQTGAAAEYIKNNQLDITPAQNAKIQAAAKEMHAIYNELYDAINETLLRNGQEPVAFRKNYAPHFTVDKPDTMLGRIRFALGLGKDSSLTIPTDLAGITDQFRPGKKWFGNLLQREGEITDFDAVKGFDRYVETAADVITLTDSIQNLRALEDAVRYRLSDEGTQAKITAIQKDREMDALEKRKALEDVYGEDSGTVGQIMKDLQQQKRMGMRGFVTELRRYTDSLAGKKSREDRGLEDMVGRQVYQLAKGINNRVSANMIAANLGSWLTNFIPITQATGEVKTTSLLKGMQDTVKSVVKDDGFADASAFLTNRRGSDSIDKTVTRKVGDALGKPMEWIDQFTADTIVRARTNDNLKKGMDLNAAIDEADSFAAGLMADRSKGSLPTIFNAKNPVTKLFTMFQVEVNNQLSYMGKDLTRRMGEKGALAVGGALTKVFVGAFIYNQLYKELTGRDAAFDPIGAIVEAFGIGDDEEDKERTAADVAASLAESVGEQVPFVGGVLFDGGRIPVSSALPNFSNLGKAVLPQLTGTDWSPEKRLETAGKELAKPAAYLLPPFAGGAVKKAVEGFATTKAGGSYEHNNQGELELQFPVYGQAPLNFAKNMIFGKWSSKDAQKYVDNGFKGLNAKETAAYNEMRDIQGIDPRAAMDAVKSLRGFETIKDADGKTVTGVKEQQRKALFNNDTLSPAQKARLDQIMIVSGEEEQPADYSDYNGFMISQYVGEKRRDAAKAALETGLSIDQFVQWDDRRRTADNEKDADGKSIPKAQARASVLDAILNDESLKPGEKQALTDTVLISDMSEKQRENWTEKAKGIINATDYVKYIDDLSAYDSEYAGTDADKAENVAAILRGYDLNDGQRDTLYQCYSGTMKNNPFHVSTYEQAINKDNGFYKDLTDSGRTEIRALCNEYEQAVNEGKELDGWMAKAYMAKEADITPETYAMFRVALKLSDVDENGRYKNDELTLACNLIPGLTNNQKAYLWQSQKGNDKTKNNPFGTPKVTKYVSGAEKAINPVDTGSISSTFGPRSSPTAGASSWHKAIDIAANAGEPVKAVMGGKVVSVNKSGHGGGYGVYVRVDHGNGIETEYHHMQEGSADTINVGDTIEQGQQIGAVGSTGISTGPHLDLQAWQDGKLVDPLTVIPGYGTGPSGYVYEGSSSSGTVSIAAAQMERDEKAKKAKRGFKPLPTLPKLKGFGF